MHASPWMLQPLANLQYTRPWLAGIFPSTTTPSSPSPSPQGLRKDLSQHLSKDGTNTVSLDGAVRTVVPGTRWN